MNGQLVEKGILFLVESVKNKKGNPFNIYRCTMCSFCHLNKEQIFQHAGDHYLREFRCDFCGRVSGDLRASNIHQKNCEFRTDQNIHSDNTCISLESRHSCEIQSQV